MSGRHIRSGSSGLELLDHKLDFEHVIDVDCELLGLSGNCVVQKSVRQSGLHVDLCDVCQILKWLTSLIILLLGRKHRYEIFY